MEDSTPLPVFRRSLRSTFKVLSDWGDSFERTHFDGDFLAAVSSAQRRVGERATRIGEELGSATVKLVEEAAGKIPNVMPDSETGAESGQAAVPPYSATTHGISGTAFRTLQPEPSAGASTGTISLWDEVQQLQDEITKEREMRRGRVAALTTLDEALRSLRTELVHERHLVERAEADRLVANGRCDASERALEEIQEEHQSLLCRRIALETDLRRHALAAAAAERAAREASREGAWAREGPETEALKIAKVALAEVLSAMDEVRLEERREAGDLQRDIEVAQAESGELQRMADSHASPTSFRSSVWRLLTVARGGDDSCTYCDRASSAT